MGDTEMPGAAVAGAPAAGTGAAAAHTPRYYKYILNAHGVSDYEESNEKVCHGEITIPENIHLQYFIDPFDKVYTVCIKEGDIEKLCSYGWMPNPIHLYTKDSDPKLPDILLSRLDDCESNTGFYDCENEEWKEAVGLGPIGILPASDTTPYFSCLSLVIASFSREFTISNPGDIAILYIAVCNKSLTCKMENVLVYYPVGNILYTHAQWNAETKKTEFLDKAYYDLYNHYLRRGYTRKNANRKLKDLSDEDLLKLYTEYLSMSRGGHRIKSNCHNTRKSRRKSNFKKKKTTRRRS